MTDIETALQTEATRFKEDFERARKEVGQIIVGQDRVVEGTLIAIVCGGNVLLEGVPGLGKDGAGKGTFQSSPTRLQPNSIHSRPHAGRYYRHQTS